MNVFKESIISSPRLEESDDVPLNYLLKLKSPKKSKKVLKVENSIKLSYENKIKIKSGEDARRQDGVDSCMVLEKRDTINEEIFYEVNDLQIQPTFEINDNIGCSILEPTTYFCRIVEKNEKIKGEIKEKAQKVVEKVLRKKEKEKQEVKNNEEKTNREEGLSRARQAEEVMQKAVQEAVANAVQKWQTNAKQQAEARKNAKIYEDILPSKRALEKHNANGSSPVKTYSVDVNIGRLDELPSLFSRIFKKNELKHSNLLLKAAFIAMQDMPSANAKWVDNHIRLFKKVDANIDIYGEGEEMSTRIPLLKDTTSKGLKDLVEFMESLKLIRSTDLNENDRNGNDSNENDNNSGTFSFHDCTKLNVKRFSPALRNNQACALGVGSPYQCVLPNDDEESEIPYITTQVVTATLVCDDRVLDKSKAVEWIQHFKFNVENPVKLFL